MTVKSEALLKVKTLSRSMAKQIQHVPYVRSGKVETLWERIHAALNDGTLEPVGWVHQDALDSIYPLGFWLVHYENRYWWFMTPNGALAGKFQNVEQLFI